MCECICFSTQVDFPLHTLFFKIKLQCFLECIFSFLNSKISEPCWTLLYLCYIIYYWIELPNSVAEIDNHVVFRRACDKSWFNKENICHFWILTLNTNKLNTPNNLFSPIYHFRNVHCILLDICIWIHLTTLHCASV